MNTFQDTPIAAPKLRKSARIQTSFASTLILSTWLLLSCGSSPGGEQSIVQVKVRETSDVPQAITISVEGKCTFSEDGQTFEELKPGRVVQQGAIIRTGDKARTDLFFRRIGTAVRLQAGTEMKLEKMTRRMKDGAPVMETLLDLRSGRIFTVVRSLIAGSTLEIRNAAGRSVVEGAAGKGRYIITADGTHVADKDSAVPLKLIGETGITVITPGQKFNTKEGKLFSANASPAVEELIDLDEIQSLAEQLTPSIAKASDDASEALVLATAESSTFDQKGSGFSKLRVGQVLTQGAVIRSGSDEVTDLFLRRWGTTIRLMPVTELALEEMSRHPGTNVPAMETHLDLRRGRIFCFIRIPVPESTFEVKTKAGRSILKSAGAGRYDIRADGTIVTGKSSFKQLQVVTEKGVVMITPGQKFTPENGYTTPAAPSEVEMMMIQMDQLVALAEQLASDEVTATEEAKK